MAVNLELLAGNKKQANVRELVTSVAELIGTKGRVDISIASKVNEKQKMLDITSNDGIVYSICCDYKLSQLLHNQVVSLTDLGAMDICRVPLLTGVDKGKLVNKVLLPESWKQSVGVAAKDMKKAEDVTAKSLYTSDQLVSW
jgi:hypothetical protein